MAGDRHDMTDAEWAILEPALPTGRPGPARKNDRRVVDGMFFVLRSGCPGATCPSDTARTRPAATAGAWTGSGRR